MRQLTRQTRLVNLLTLQSQGYCEECGNWDYDLIPDHGLRVCSLCFRGNPERLEPFVYGAIFYPEMTRQERASKKAVKEHLKEMLERQKERVAEQKPIYPQFLKIPKPPVPTPQYYPFAAVGPRQVWCRSRNDFDNKKLYAPSDLVCVLCSGKAELCNVKLWNTRRMWDWFTQAESAPTRTDSSDAQA